MITIPSLPPALAGGISLVTSSGFSPKRKWDQSPLVIKAIPLQIQLLDINSHEEGARSFGSDKIIV
jgi:hypothetical protein